VLVLPQSDGDYGFRVPVAGGATAPAPCGPSGPVALRWFEWTQRPGHTLNSLSVKGGGPGVEVAVAAYATSPCADAGSPPLCNADRDPASNVWPKVSPEVAAGETVWLGVYVKGTPTESLYVRADD
jgi:hypothetical protein